MIYKLIAAMLWSVILGVAVGVVASRIANSQLQTIVSSLESALR